MGQKFYALWHERLDANGCDHDKLLGIYSSRENAEQALALVRDRPGFRDYPEGFEIVDGVMDEIYMREGFITVHGDEPAPRSASGL